MGLSDAEIEMRLAALRRQREALDREIADLVLYQELGRRLGAVKAEAGIDAGAGAHGSNPDTGPVPAAVRPFERDTTLAAHPAGPRARPSDPAPDPAPRAARASGQDLAATGSPAPGPSGVQAVPEGVPPAVAFTDDVAGARRYGRAVVEAACTALARAGRPLHAAEILDVLTAQGFTLPGRDPVAGLNTRLWKRSGPGGPLRRVGEATYGLAADRAADPAHP
ncbi:winged helix-turn-helix domain-containing protein [Methylobacterium sp. GC_Met_2]|uniref:winged helix-turn-helix domain-containing protein n=1 Tax=Methylobacterium sp. GC_Met_2 TaxID=2937376 RepID=UPI00226B4258|nr:winged helix-turn-helix domain-containing protein [Methylobacterium sp. GC_Met_2]